VAVMERAGISRMMSFEWALMGSQVSSALLLNLTTVALPRRLTRDRDVQFEINGTSECHRP
jgi:hypothetical protein